MSARALVRAASGGLVALAVFVVACSKSAPTTTASPAPTTAPVSSPVQNGTPATPSATPAASTPASPAASPAPSTSPPLVDQTRDQSTALLGSAPQLVTATVADWTSITAELRLWKRAGDRWELVRGPWPGVVGSGTAWGSGIHGDGAPAGREGPVKREGDGKSPAGAFAVRKSYGYAKSAATALAYQPVDSNWKCVDDAKSAVYNQIVDRRTVDVDWKSAENMRRKDVLYTWVVDLAHNAQATPGAGSCIFLHVWRDAKSPTVGCTAMPESELEKLLADLQPEAVYVLLPRAEYDVLAPAWGLPPL